MHMLRVPQRNFSYVFYIRFFFTITQPLLSDFTIVKGSIEFTCIFTLIHTYHIIDFNIYSHEFHDL